MNDKDFLNLLDNAPINQNITKYLLVTRQKLSQFERIVLSYSGGSDSDTILDIVELIKPNDCGEIRYVFFDTGLEWDATLRHLEEVEARYGVSIEVKKPKKTIPAACKEHGVPFISKDVSEKLERLQLHDFNWSVSSEDATTNDCGSCKSSLDWFYGRLGKKRISILHYKRLKDFLTYNPPAIKISDKCCLYAKKNIADEYNKEFRADLSINGMRQAEGGRRIGAVKNCFTLPSDEKAYAEYRPLWFWTDADKAAYKTWRGLKYSDCYEVWGFMRTGCVGCPCSSACLKQLKIAELYEPNKVKAAFAVFGKSYEYREKYNYFKKYGTQISLFNEEVNI
jgi:3'-phosphoadenosine 5'-phosphosulfate sulfotransferase (PAPS reductase)/FAD synthetase